MQIYDYFYLFTTKTAFYLRKKTKTLLFDKITFGDKVLAQYLQKPL